MFVYNLLPRFKNAYIFSKYVISRLCSPLKVLVRNPYTSVDDVHINSLTITFDLDERIHLVYDIMGGAYRLSGKQWFW